MIPLPDPGLEHGHEGRVVVDRLPHHGLARLLPVVVVRVLARRSRPVLVLVLLLREQRVIGTFDTCLLTWRGQWSHLGSVVRPGLVVAVLRVPGRESHPVVPAASLVVAREGGTLHVLP